MALYSVEAALVAWLKSHGFAAAQLMQQGRSGVFVTVERVGGGVSDLIDRPSVAFQIWGDTNEQALQAALEVRALLLTAPLPDGVSACVIDSGPYFFADMETRRPRYQIVADLASQLYI